MSKMAVQAETFFEWLQPESAFGRRLPDPVKTCAPYFLALMMLEFLVSILTGKKVYNLRQTVSNVAAGTFLRLCGVFMKALLIFPYATLREHFGVVPDAQQYGLAMYVAAFLLADHSYYWFHRTAHMSNLGWSAHVVHHSSCDYNFSTALRQGAGESAIAWLYYLALSPFVPLELYLTHKGISTILQFWVHTDLIPKLWWPIEFVMNTPSHHRVHHARNYGRANFGGGLIVWDRLYGTFEEEQESRPCIYGLDNKRVPTGAYNPLWQQMHHLVATLRLAASDVRHALSALFTRRYGPGMVVPAAIATSTGAKVPPASEGLDADPRRPNGWFPWEAQALGCLDFYAAFHLISILLLYVVYFPQLLASLTPLQFVLAYVFGLASLITSVGVMDGTHLALRCELARLAAAMVLAPSLVIVLHPDIQPVLMASLAVSGLAIIHQLGKLGGSSKAKML